MANLLSEIEAVLVQWDDMGKAYDFLRTHHAEIAAAVRKASLWDALCADCDGGEGHATPINIVTDACNLGSGALERHYAMSAREGQG